MSDNLKEEIMGYSDYTKAYKLGKKDYQYRMLHGLLPTLEVLDDIIPTKGTFSEVPLGLVQIPTEQIVGTKTNGRSNAFAANFMPILRETSEFASKWAKLSTSHENEGIREPIKAYEYMNKFYVLEGNKRVSVMKYYGAVSVPGTVIRIVPKRTDEKENKIYFEFMDFYELTNINYIWFSEEGSCRKWLERGRMKSGLRTNGWSSALSTVGLWQSTRREIRRSCRLRWGMRFWHLSRCTVMKRPDR